MAGQTSQASSFTVKELTGDQRTVRLAGRALPHRGTISFGGKQRSEKTWYPGNPVATRQVLGPTENPMDPNGEWDDRYLGTTDLDGKTVNNPEAIAELNGSQVTTAIDLAEIFDDIRRKGQTLEVTWDKLIRIGELEEFVFRPLRRETVQWTMRFDWDSQDDPSVAAVVTKQVDLSDVGGSWLDQAASIAAKIGAVSGVAENILALASNAINTGVSSPFAMAPSFGTQLVSNVNTVLSDIQGVADAIASMVSQESTPLSGAQRIVGVLASIADDASTAVDQMRATPVQANYNLPAPPGAPIPFANVVAAQVWQRDLYDAVRSAERQAALQQQDIARQVNPDLIAVVVGQQGQDLREVSTEWYGTPDQWKTIEQFNGLSSSALLGGEILFIPAAQTGGQ